MVSTERTDLTTAYGSLVGSRFLPVAAESGKRGGVAAKSTDGATSGADDHE